ncbi:MAG: L-seryl-tRNA(Sec) selenium transferase [Planctomycetota bacterium]|nr:L-seryl-tRNA(Sec) selenium transferase [Planctomycetota bacterium]
MQPSKDVALRKIPAVDVLLQDPALQESAQGVPRRIVVDAVRAAADEMRSRLLAQPPPDVADVRTEILARARARIGEAWTPHYRRAINATGIILHTGLGRAVLPAKAVRQIAEELSGYSLLQVDIETGKRSRRDARLEWMLQQLTGCEAATVVNNNAAATMIVLNAVARGKEVIVSRGQLVEIGGSFRLPEVMAASGAKLVEVGTTNKTHPRDYENAITDSTAAILRVHPSNYRIFGFTAEVALEELVRIAHAHNLVLIDDVGAGALLDLSRFGFTDEPTLPDSIRQGADLVTSSADKLIGGSQGGIILGKAALVEKVRKNPLARILRVGKLTLAALEATIGLFFDESLALSEVPTLEMLVRELGQVNAQAERIAAAIRSRAPGAAIAVIDGASQVGSGSLPTRDIPTRLVAVAPAKLTPDALAARLRRGAPPVFARIQEDKLLIDPRTLLAGDEEPLIDALGAAMAAGE